MANRERKPMPGWMKEVDRDMFLYVTWERVIRHQEDIIFSHRLSGIRTTPIYGLREGSGGGETLHQAEKIAFDIDFAEKKIEAGRSYRANIDEIIKSISAVDPDREVFIRRYWLTSTDKRVSTRTKLVIAALPFLAHREWGTGRPTKQNGNFYRWREGIYSQLAEYLGYGDEIK